VLESGNLLIVLRSLECWFAGKSLWHPYQYIEQSFFSCKERLRLGELHFIVHDQIHSSKVLGIVLWTAMALAAREAHVYLSHAWVPGESNRDPIARSW
jgi:hypothetical protein